MARVDAHQIKPHAYRELLELTDEMLVRAAINQGGGPRLGEPRPAHQPSPAPKKSLNGGVPPSLAGKRAWLGAWLRARPPLQRAPLNPSLIGAPTAGHQGPSGGAVYSPLASCFGGPPLKHRELERQADWTHIGSSPRFATDVCRIRSRAVCVARTGTAQSRCRDRDLRRRRSNGIWRKPCRSLRCLCGGGRGS